MLGLGLSIPKSSVGAPASVFSPDDIPGLNIWFDADDASTITLNGSDVSEWRDKSSNGIDVSNGTASQQPEYNSQQINGKPTLEFGIDGFERLESASNALLPSGAEAFTGFVVAKANNLTGTRRLFGWGGGAVGGTPHIVRFIAPARWAYTFFGVPEYALVTSAPAPTTSPTYLSFKFNGTTIFGFADGVATTPASLVPDPVSVASPTTFLVGRPFISWDGLIAEILLYDSALSTEDQEAVESYLAAKWGI